MTDGRARRKTKQARRDARRRRARERPPDESPLAPLLAREHPVVLLRLVGSIMPAADPDLRVRREAGEVMRDRLDGLVDRLSESPKRETTALLAVLGGLLPEDSELAARCRREVESRSDLLPAWITGLPEVQVYKAVRLSHVLGDHDEVVIGARLVGGKELTCAAVIDHNHCSWVTNATVFAGSIDGAIADFVERGLHPDLSFVDMTVADARAWIEGGLKHAVAVGESGTWPASRPLLQWLARHMPEGGTSYRPDEWGPAAINELFREFFASPQGALFADVEYRVILEELLDTGCGDPLRWSAPRVRQALAWTTDFEDDISVECRLDVPDVLRAFIPFVHAKSVIREGLTAEAVAVIDKMRLAYKRDVLRDAGYYDADDEGA